MQLTDGGKTFLTRTIWIYVVTFAMLTVLNRHRETLLFWTDCGSFALLFPPAMYFTARRMKGRL